MKNKFTFKTLLVLGIAMLGLNACSKTDLSAQEALNQFTQTVKTVKAVDGSVKVKMTGVESRDNIDLTAVVSFKADHRVQANRKLDISVLLDGNLVAEGKSLSGKLEAMIRVIDKEFYANLIQLDANDPSIQSFQPFLAPYKGQWLHVASDFIPENIRDLNTQEGDEAKAEQLKQLFADANLFRLDKAIGIETVNNKEVLHFTVKLDRKALENYVRQAAQINGREMTEAEVQEAATIADAVSRIELWVGTKDFFLYQGVVSLTGANLEQGAQSGIDVTYTANSYNRDLSISPPADYQEFNPLALLGGLQLPQGALDAEGREGGDTE